MTAYKGQIASLVNDDSYELYLSDAFSKTEPSVTDTLELQRGSVNLIRSGSDQNLFTTIIPSSLQFTFIADTSQRETYLNNVIADNTSEWYVLLFKNNSLFWWGYLDAEIMSINREYKPRYSFEAFDILTKTGTMGFWDYNPYGFPTSSIFGMGYRENGAASGLQIPTTGYDYSPYTSNKYTTLLGIIYSCLFDTDQQNLGEQDLNVVQWDVDDTTQTPGNTRNIENWICESIDDFFFEDPLNWFANSGFNGNQNKNWRISEILHNICLSFRARLFQRNGEYYFVQWEAYNGDTSSNNFRIHEFDNRQVTPTSNYPSEIIMPRHSTSSSLSASEYKQSLDAPRTNPELEPGTNVEYITGIDSVKLKAKATPTNDVYLNYERSINYTISANGPFNNFGAPGRKVVQSSIEWPFGNWKKLVYPINGWPTDKITRWNGTSFVRQNLMEHLTDAFMEYSNGPRKNLHVTIRGDFDFLQALTLDSTTFLVVSSQSNLEFDSHQVSAIEFTNSLTNLGDIKRESDDTGGGGGVGTGTGSSSGGGTGGSNGDTNPGGGVGSGLGNTQYPGGGIG